MDVDLELVLDERLDDRVHVSFWLHPAPGGVHVEGAALALVDAEGDEICPRTLLPVSGRVTGPIALSVELRGPGVLPAGARVVASAWWRDGQVQTSVPADPYITLEAYAAGAGAPLPAPLDVDLVVPAPERRAVLEARMPWVARPLRPSDVAVIEAREPAPEASDLAEELGLGAEDAAWLEELLSEDDP